MNADIQYYSDATIHSISEKLLLDILANYLLLGPRGPLVPSLVDPSVRPCAGVQGKSGALIYRHICFMNQEWTHRTDPMVPWDPLDAPLDPLAPQSTPSDPKTGVLAS